MQAHATDDQVFIRSMANRGHLGGLAAATPQAIRVLDAAGFDLILVETVGVGQAEIDIASLADSVVVLVAPGMGDAIQAAKAGILEVADLFVVNKADKPDSPPGGAGPARHARAGGARHRAPGSRRSSRTVAVNGPDGRGHRRAGDAAWTRTGPGSTPPASCERRRHARAREEITALVFAELRHRLAASNVDELAARVADGTLDPFDAAEETWSPGTCAPG